MADRGNPWDTPEWFAFRREATLARDLIGTGVTALGRANYADGKGEYYNAFFGLSVGIERLAKLILVVDHMLDHQGQLPSAAEIKKFGHGLNKLRIRVEEIVSARQLDLEYARPDDAIADAIVACLDSFADAKKGRYANLEALGNPNFGGEFEPIRKYWNEVAVPILKQHYRGKAIEARVTTNAQAIAGLMGDAASVLHFDESGDMIKDTETASTRTGQTEVVQRWGRYYTLLTVRWLADVYSSLARTACYEQGMDGPFGTWEYFWTYTVSDEFLKTRKRWPLN